MRIAWALDPYWRSVSRVPAFLVVVAAVFLLIDRGVSPADCLGEGRRDIYGALLTTFSTLLGISYAVTAMIIGFSDRANLSVYVKSDDYPDIALMMRDTNRSLALSSVIAFSLMIVEQRAVEPWILVVLLGSATWALSILGMAMNRFTTMLHRVAASTSEDARKKTKDALEKFLENGIDPNIVDKPVD